MPVDFSRPPRVTNLLADRCSCRQRHSTKVQVHPPRASATLRPPCQLHNVPHTHTVNHCRAPQQSSILAATQPKPPKVQALSVHDRFQQPTKPLSPGTPAKWSAPAHPQQLSRTTHIGSFQRARSVCSSLANCNVTVANCNVSVHAACAAYLQTAMSLLQTAM